MKIMQFFFQISFGDFIKFRIEGSNFKEDMKHAVPWLNSLRSCDTLNKSQYSASKRKKIHIVLVLRYTWNTMWYFKTPTWLFQAFMKASMSEGSLFLLCIKMASAPIKIAIRSCLLHVRYKENTHTCTQKIWRETLELMHLHSGMLRLASKLRPIPSQQWTPLHGQRCKSQDRSGCLYMPFKKIIFKKNINKISSSW